mmetsp:Transcript_16913/g.28560  ORF Transcript_16913/g.28560 Transcript_16913/m.28560 type:complete len:379 (+) Transcript_16913:163-1299(+)
MQQIRRFSAYHYGCVWQVLVQNKLPHVVVNIFRRKIHEIIRNYQHVKLLYSFTCAHVRPPASTFYKSPTQEALLLRLPQNSERLVLALALADGLVVLRLLANLLIARGQDGHEDENAQVHNVGGYTHGHPNHTLWWHRYHRQVEGAEIVVQPDGGAEHLLHECRAATPLDADVDVEQHEEEAIGGGHQELVLNVRPVAGHELKRRQGVVPREERRGDEQPGVPRAEQARELYQVVHRQRVRRRTDEEDDEEKRGHEWQEGERLQQRVVARMILNADHLRQPLAHQLLARLRRRAHLGRDVRHEGVPGGIDAARHRSVDFGGHPILVPQVVPIQVVGIVPGPAVVHLLLLLIVEGAALVGHVPVLPLPIRVVLQARLFP